MRIDRVKLIAEMARQSIKAQDLADKACVAIDETKAFSGYGFPAWFTVGGFRQQ